MQSNRWWWWWWCWDLENRRHNKVDLASGEGENYFPLPVYVWWLLSRHSKILCSWKDMDGLWKYKNGSRLTISKEERTKGVHGTSAILVWGGGEKYKSESERVETTWGQENLKLCCNLNQPGLFLIVFSPQRHHHHHHFHYSITFTFTRSILCTSPCSETFSHNQHHNQESSSMLSCPLGGITPPSAEQSHLPRLLFMHGFEISKFKCKLQQRHLTYL